MSAPDVPPPSPALLERLSDLRPVRTRRPRLDATLVALGSLGATAALLLTSRLRGDLASPLVLAAAAACALGFAVELWWALVPPRGQVLPLRRASGLRVAAVWALLCVVLVAAGHDARAVPVHDFMVGARGCFFFGCAMALAPALLCLLVLRKTLDLGGWRLGAVVGGAAGALGGLGLELHCANGHAMHVLVAHGGAIALPALLLALVVRR
ncbi:MAG: hypothetical protein JWN44_4932 [Myxococcales bacterium]|nr:hypothetical protein [Myxococcales bacterium]